ncbi:MAG: hypothetical protein KAH54_00805 [Candidatus Sabulitectum sp.]|nr:hypothetical protein [Candidatus Sabulitectum sp.]
MQIVTFTAETMLNRAVRIKSRLWLTIAMLTGLFVITPGEKALEQLVSFLVLFPAVLLLTNWNNSHSRNGILALTTRGDGNKKVRIAEWVLPALAGIIISSIAVFAVSAPPPWQFWVVSPLTATSFSLVFLIIEQHLKYPGRTILSLMWLFQLTGSEQTGGIANLLLFTGYPSAVLVADPASVAIHPDSYVMASLVVVFLTTTGYAFLQRRNP